MVKDPRSPKSHSSEPDETIELLRALARRRGIAQPPTPAAPPAAPDAEDETFGSLRSLAERLDLQLRAPPAEDAPEGRSRASSRAPPPEQMQESRPRRLGAGRGQWAEFAAALPPARALVPHLSASRIIFIFIAVAVLAVAGIGRLVGPRIAATVPPPTPQTAPAASAPAEAAPPLDIPTITKAMTACDQQAARDPGSLYFLVLPLVEVVHGKHDWRAVALQTVVNAYFLLSDKDALDGLRDKSLALRADRYTFAVLDPASGTSYSWTSATGLSRLSRPGNSELKAIKLGFDFSARQTGPQWSAEFNREPGTCYSVNVLVVE